MAASMSSELKAEPNLTPLLDVVFQLITFFMLVINFSNENYDQRVRLPVAGSARPVEDEQRVSEDRLVLNVDSEGHLLMGGEVQPLHKAIQTIKHQADLVKLNLKAAGIKLDADREPADHDRPPGRQGGDVLVADQPDQGLPVQRVPEVRLQGDEHDRSVGSRSTDGRVHHGRGDSALSERKKSRKAQAPEVPDRADAGHGVSAPDVLRPDLSSRRRPKVSS